MKNRNIIVPMLIFFLGILLVFLSVFRGDANIAIMLFIPIIYGGGLLIAVGILMIFLSFFLFFFLPFTNYHNKSEKREQTYQVKENTRSGGVIFIGPIPIIFGGDQSTAKKMMYVGLIIALILAALYAVYIFS